MKAMVLAAGRGHRLRPLTAYWAKPTLPILGRPLLDYTLALLEKASIQEIVVNLHHQRETIKQALREAEERGFSIHYSEEPEILGTAGGLKQAESFLTGETFVLINGDTLVDVDLRDLVRCHRRWGGEATLLLRPKPAGTDYTALVLDPEQRVVSMGGVPTDPLMFAGVWVLEPSVFERIVPGRSSGLEVEVLPTLMREKSVYGCVKDVTWFDIGSPRRYLTACLKTARNGWFRDLWRVGEVSDASSEVVAGPGTTIHPMVRFVGESVLGSRCRVEARAIIQRSVLWDHVVVREGAVVRSSIITDGVELPPGSRTENKMVLRDRGDSAPVRSQERTNHHVVAPIKH